MSRPLVKLFIKNFGKETNKREIESAFEKYGEIYECKVNLAKAYAIVCYRNTENADKAIKELDGSS